MTQRFEGKHALVVGGASGIGEVAGRLYAAEGGRVTVMDIVEPTYDCDNYIQVDLSDLNSVESALLQLDTPVNALFSCAGVASGDALVRINFIAQRFIIQELVTCELLGVDSAVCMISSLAGHGWQQEFQTLKAFLAKTSWEEANHWAETWLSENPDRRAYQLSKQAMNAYVALASYELLGKGIRINVIEPGPTDTPLARANAAQWLGFASEFRESVGLSASSPADMANVMLFLCSGAAKGINGQAILVDQGYLAARSTGAW